MVRLTASLATAVLAFTPSVLAGPASKKTEEKPVYKNFLDQFKEDNGNLFQAEPQVQFFPTEEFADYANITEIKGAPPNPEKYERERRYIIGDDDRKYWRGGESVFTPNFPGDSVGRLQIDGGGICSAALVGPRHILTARHCVWQQTGFRFSPSYDRSARLGTTGAGVIFTSDPKNDDTSSFACNVVSDWAILVIDERLGDQLGYFGFTTPDPAKFDKPIYISQGYAGDIENAQIPVRQVGNQIHTKRSLECKGLGYLATDTDAEGGQSGSPFWSEDENGNPAIVGVLSGGAKTSDGNGGVDAWTMLASGTSMVRWIQWMRDNYP